MTWQWTFSLRLAFVLCASSVLAPQTSADWDWVNDHFTQALDTLMPLHRTTGYYVVDRAHRDLHTNVPEYWFMIGYDGNAAGPGLQTSLTAHVRVADVTSIYDQLMHMHRSDPHQDAASMEKKIKVKSWDMDEATCPSIKKRINELEHLRSQPLNLNSDVIVLHPMNHEFHIQTADVDTQSVIWKDEHPLVRWALATRHTLESCQKR